MYSVRNAQNIIIYVSLFLQDVNAFAADYTQGTEEIITLCVMGTPYVHMMSNKRSCAAKTFDLARKIEQAQLAA